MATFTVYTHSLAGSLDQLLDKGGPFTVYTHSLAGSLDQLLDKGGPFTVYTHSLAGSLDQLLDKGGPFTELTVCNYTGQIIRGVAYLHENGIIHRDLKGANILVNQTGESVLIADFGTAATLKTSTTVTGEFKDTKGTAPFMAPEVGYNIMVKTTHIYMSSVTASGIDSLMHITDMIRYHM